MSPLHRGKVVLGYTDSELCRKGSGYQFIHAADMMHCAENHVRSEFGRRPQGPTPPRGAGANPPPACCPPLLQRAPREGRCASELRCERRLSLQ